MAITDDLWDENDANEWESLINEDTDSEGTSTQQQKNDAVQENTVQENVFEPDTGFDDYDAAYDTGFDDMPDTSDQSIQDDTLEDLPAEIVKPSGKKKRRKKQKSGSTKAKTNNDKSKKKWIIPAIILIFILLASVLTALLLKNNNQDNEPQPQETQTSATQAQTPEQPVQLPPEQQIKKDIQDIFNSPHLNAEGTTTIELHPSRFNSTYTVEGVRRSDITVAETPAKVFSVNEYLFVDNETGVLDFIVGRPLKSRNLTEMLTRPSDFDKVFPTISLVQSFIDAETINTVSPTTFEANGVTITNNNDGSFNITTLDTDITVRKATTVDPAPETVPYTGAVEKQPDGSWKAFVDTDSMLHISNDPVQQPPVINSNE